MPSTLARTVASAQPCRLIHADSDRGRRPEPSLSLPARDQAAGLRCKRRKWPRRQRRVQRRSPLTSKGTTAMCDCSAGSAGGGQSAGPSQAVLGHVPWIEWRRQRRRPRAVLASARRLAAALSLTAAERRSGCGGCGGRGVGGAGAVDPCRTPRRRACSLRAAGPALALLRL